MLCGRGRPQALGRPGAQSGGHPGHRGARAGADGLPQRLLLGPCSPNSTPASPIRAPPRPVHRPAGPVSVDGKRVATGRDFDSVGSVKKPDEVLVLNEAAATALATGLRGAAH